MYAQMAASSQRAAGRQAGDGSVSPELLKQVIDGWDDQVRFGSDS